MSLPPPPPFPKKTVFDTDQYYTEVTKYLLSLPDEDVDSPPANKSPSTIETSAPTPSVGDTDRVTAKDTDPSPSNHDAEWLNPITKDEFLLKKFHAEVQQLKSSLSYSQSLFKKGTIVFTFSRFIATKSLKPNNVRESGNKTMGTVVKRSEIFPDLFLVNFYDVKKYRYVTEDVIRYDSGCTPTSLSLASSIMKTNNNITESSIKHDNEEVIMTSILNAKIHMTPGHNNLTMSELFNLFVPTYKWLTINKLNYCLAKEKKALAAEVGYDTATNVRNRSNNRKQASYSHVLLDNDPVVCEYIYMLLFHLLLNESLCTDPTNLTLIQIFQLAPKSTKLGSKSEDAHVSSSNTATKSFKRVPSQTRKTIEAVRSLKLNAMNTDNDSDSMTCKYMSLLIFVCINT